MSRVLSDLLHAAETELATVRSRRADLERAERVAAEKVRHVRALMELEGSNAPNLANTEPTAEALSLPETTDQRSQSNVPLGANGSTIAARPEDIAAEILGERGSLHYRELWQEVARRGAVIVSSNPAGVLLTRISRDDRFTRGKGRGVYRLGLLEGRTEPKVKPRKRGIMRRRRRERQGGHSDS